MKFRKLKTLDYYSMAHELQNAIPQLKKIDSEIIADRLMGTNLKFFKEEVKPVNKWVRLTLPFALIVFVILIIASPIKYMITGTWGYSSRRLENWYRSLRF